MDSRIAKSVDFPQSVCTSYGIHSQNRDHSVDTGKIRYSEPSVRKDTILVRLGTLVELKLS